MFIRSAIQRLGIRQRSLKPQGSAMITRYSIRIIKHWTALFFSSSGALSWRKRRLRSYKRKPLSGYESHFPSYERIIDN
jgi:hypothetical protein